MRRARQRAVRPAAGLRSVLMERRQVDRDLVLLAGLATIKLAFHVATNGQYGFHRDELATLDDARHLAWGFVAYPPLTPFLARIALAIFGTSLTGFRFFAALAQSAAFVVTGLLARRFGAGRGGMLIAAFAAAIAPIALAASALMQYVSFDYLWFVLMAYFVVRLASSEDPRWWVAIGVMIGLGVLTKYAVAFYVAGLAAGVLLTPLRAQLRSKWLWIGALVSLFIALPNLIWQVRHDYISITFLQFIHARDVRIGRTGGFLVEQLTIASNLITVPLWLVGLYVVFREQRYRVIGWMYVVTMALFIVAKARGYYSGPLYPMLFAAGATALPRRRLVYVAAALLLVAFGSLAALISLPLAPINSVEWKFASGLNPDFVEEIGWPELTREVARVWSTIPPGEQSHTGIYCGNYGEAGAIDLYGPEYGLPPAISGINSYWLRGPGNPPPVTFIVVGAHRENLERRFTSVQLVGQVTNGYGVLNEETREHRDIYLCRGLRDSIVKLWPQLRSFG
jgi:Dolichyl-phosphate-mannose-protein mannosyltransferase